MKKLFKHALVPLVAGILMLVTQLSWAQVQVYRGVETIPTYRMGPDEKSPVFYTGRGVQGAAGHYYPYPAQISLTDEKTEVAYEMVYLENEYLKVTIVPALGGKLFSAIDKTNGRELFHRNSSIKPDLIGTLGAWISGGIEWCFPHHHRVTTLLPADYCMVKNPDGSATVWIGETEKSLRLRGVIGITLRPGRSFIEADYRLTNPNPVNRHFKFWANVAVTADENFRTFWPPSQEIAVFHNNTSFARWPVSREVYRGIDYTEGIDLTWWKNNPSHVSFFFWQGEEGFIGGYNYADKAGTIHVGDTYKSRISKLWQFGPGLQGQNARRKLTDDGAAYVELMTGTFSNNQPDYSWFAPHMVKHDKHYWYPLRDLEMAKKATPDAAITLQVKDGNRVFYGVNTTRKMEDALLLLSYDKELVVSDTIDVDPAHPFTSTWESTDELEEGLLHLEFKDGAGNDIVVYTPRQPKHPDLPEPFEDFRPAGEYETLEELYLAGRGVEQFSRPFLDPEDYYLKALEISPTDYRVNLAMGIRRVQQWRYAEAKAFFQTAASTLRHEYIQIKEGELYYHWALAQRAQGKTREALRNFSYAAYHYAWFSPANFQLAQMHCEEGDWETALARIEDAYSTNNHEASIVMLYSALLRRAGRGSEALGMLHKAIKFDPLNYGLLYERQLITGETPIGQMQGNMQDVENNYIEIATHYLNAGLHEEATLVLSGVTHPRNPLFLYYQAYALAQQGQESEAKGIIRAAGRMGHDYVFPYRIESERVLRHAIEADPSSAMGHYLLGNLLYDRRPDEAIAAWEKAASIDPELTMVRRNLAFAAFQHSNQADNAIDLLRGAILETPDHPLWYAELVRYYEASDRDPEECLELLEANRETVLKNVSAPQGLVKLYNLTGAYDKAIQLLGSHHFRTWEGGRTIYWHYVDAHVLKALDLIDRAGYEEAVDHLVRAMDYPENLEVGKPLNDERNALMYYLMGKAYSEMGRDNDAREAFQKSVECENSRSWPDLNFYQGLSYQELGEFEKANEKFDQLENRAKRLLDRSWNTSGTGIGVDESGSVESRKSISEGYYLQGLLFLAQNNLQEAQNMFRKSSEIYRYHLWAKLLMEHRTD